MSVNIPSDQKTKKLHVYLAGPDVFYPNPMEIGSMKKQLVTKTGCIAHFPLDSEIKDIQPNEATALKIAKENEDLLDLSEVILVNMTPWHGPSMDVGTAFETGYMSAKAKFCPDKVLIIGYYEGAVKRNFVERVADMVYQNEIIFHPSGLVTDKKGNTLENFSLCENLMITSTIKKTGGYIFSSFGEAVDNILTLWIEKQEKANSVDCSFAQATT